MRVAGFTLIEVLVAIAIIAAIAVAIGVGLSGLGGTRELEREAERFAARIGFACESAELDGRALGWRQVAGGYEFLERHLDGWRVLQAPDALAPYRVPAAFALELVRDGERIGIAPAGAPIAPQLACFASGELTPFTATWTAQGATQRFRVAGDADGAVTLETFDAAR